MSAAPHHETGAASRRRDTISNPYAGDAHAVLTLLVNSADPPSPEIARVNQGIVVRGSLRDPTHIELDEPVTALHGVVEVVLRAAPGSDAAHPAASVREQEIDALYAEIHALAAATAGGDPASEARYQDRLARLRELEDAEAREMALFAERRRQVPRGAVASVLDHVDALLETHDHPSGSNPAGRSRH